MSATAPGYRPGTEEVRLSRKMSGFSVTMIGVGAMIGAGIFVLTGIAAGGASETGKAGNFVTMAKVLIILFFVAAGAWAMRGMPEWQGSFQPFLPNGLGAVFSAMGLTFIAFQGDEAIAQGSAG